MGSFFGLEIGKRALMTQQMALTVTGHNMANTNTLGYSRQMSNMVTTIPYYSPSLLIGGGRPGQLGTGVEIDAIYRVRDYFLDRQYRYENQAGAYWGELQVAYARLEAIGNEPTDTGLRTVLDQFWAAWQDLSLNPESAAVRRVLVERGKAVADAFQNTYSQLVQLRTDMNENVKIKVSEINTIAEEIAVLNKKIQLIKATGQRPNDLEDKRDLLLDQLSSIVGIETKFDEKGRINVRVGNRYLIQGTNAFKLETVQDTENMSMVVWKDDKARATIESGQLRAYLDARGRTNLSRPANYPYEKEPSEYKEIIPNMIADLEKLAQTVIEQTNSIHRIGYSLNNHGQLPDGTDFFALPADGISWSRLMAVEVDIIKDVNNIAASSKPTYDINGNVSAFGNGKNAIMIAQLKQSINADRRIITGNIQLSPDITFDLRYNGGTIHVTVNGADYQDLAERNEAIRKAIESALRGAGINTAFTVSSTNGAITIASKDGNFEGIDNLVINGTTVAPTLPYVPTVTTKALASANSPDIELTVLYAGNRYSVRVGGNQYNTAAERAAALQTAIRNATGNSSFTVAASGRDFTIDCGGDPAFTGIENLAIGGINQGTYTKVPVIASNKPLRPDITMQVIYGGVTSNVTVPGEDYYDPATRAAAVKSALDLATGGTFTVTVDGGALVISSTDTTFSGIVNLTIGAQDYGSYPCTPSVTTVNPIPLIYDTDVVINLQYNGGSVIVNMPKADYADGDEMAKAIQTAINNALGVDSFYVTNYDGRLIISSTDSKFEGINGISIASQPFNYFLGNMTTLADPGDNRIHSQSVDDFWRSVLAELGVSRQDAIHMDDNQALIVEELNNKREAVSGVNMDEEGTNLIKYQNAYNAAARYITTIDEMLEVLINRTGVVGR